MFAIGPSSGKDSKYLLPHLWSHRSSPKVRILLRCSIRQAIFFNKRKQRWVWVVEVSMKVAGDTWLTRKIVVSLNCEDKIKKEDPKVNSFQIWNWVFFEYNRWEKRRRNPSQGIVSQLGRFDCYVPSFGSWVCKCSVLGGGFRGSSDFLCGWNEQETKICNDMQ